MPQDTITVRILEGRNLIAADRGGTSDPYAVVRVDTTKHKTKIIKKCLNPKWMETFKFTVQNTKTSKIVVEIWDKDFLKKDDPLGCVTIPLTNLEKGVEKLEWYNLNGVPKGQVYVGVTADTFDTAAGGNSLAKNNNYPISGSGQPPQDPFNSNNSLYPPPVAQPFNSMPNQFYPGQMSYPPQMYPPDPYTSMPMGNPYGQYPPQPNQYPPQLNYPPPQNYGSSLPPQPNQYPPQLNYPPPQNYGSSLPPQPGQYPPGAQPGQYPPGAQPPQNYGSSLPQPGQYPPGAQPGQYPPGAQPGQPGQPGQFPPGQQGY